MWEISNRYKTVWVCLWVPFKCIQQFIYDAPLFGRIHFFLSSFFPNCPGVKIFTIGCKYCTPSNGVQYDHWKSKRNEMNNNKKRRRILQNFFFLINKIFFSRWLPTREHWRASSKYCCHCNRFDFYGILYFIPVHIYTQKK